jgi:conjugative transfer pilus assembly protein TraH
MSFKPFISGVSIAILVASASASADIGSKVDSWFNANNFSNVTSPGVYESQAARNYSLGGISTRADVTRPMNLVNLTAPRFSAGCGGIDAYMGGFSHIDADQFIDNLRNIGENAQGLAFMLAIQIVSPQLSGIMEEINTWAQRINALNQGSCEAATALMGGVMEMAGQTEGNCTVKRMNDYGEDWTTANHACTTNGGRKATENDGNEVNFADFVKGNLAWHVLMEDAYFRNDLVMSQMIMNITGTLLIRDTDEADENAPSEVSKIMPALSETGNGQRFKNIYAALLHGDEAESELNMYMCEGTVTNDKDGCSSISIIPVDVPRDWTGLHQRVSTLMVSIIDKVKTDTPLTDEERGLVSNTRLPLYRYITAVAVNEGSNAVIALRSSMTDKYAELIARQILNDALNSILELTLQRSGTVTGGISNGKSMLAFQSDLKNALGGVAKLQLTVEESEKKLEQLIKEVNLFEGQFLASIQEDLKRSFSFKG